MNLHRYKMQLPNAESGGGVSSTWVTGVGIFYGMVAVATTTPGGKAGTPEMLNAFLLVALFSALHYLTSRWNWSKYLTLVVASCSLFYSLFYVFSFFFSEKPEEAALSIMYLAQFIYSVGIVLTSVLKKN